MAPRLTGAPVSPGVAIGPAFVVDRRRIAVVRRDLGPGEDAVAAELSRLTAAIEASRDQVAHVRERLGADGTPSELVLIVESHRMLLDDETFALDAARIVREERVNAEWAVRTAAQRAADALDATADDYFRSRKDDVAFVGERIIRNLLGRSQELASGIPPRSVLVAHDLSPVDMAQAVRGPVAGFATEAGSRTSHTAILARGYGVPAVVGVEGLLERVRPGDVLAIDGMRGEVVIAPTGEDVVLLRERARTHAELERALHSERDLPAETIDGLRVHLMANIEFPGEAAVALEHGAEGIGLYRTEFLYIGRETPPDEEEQARVYSDVVGMMAPRPVTLRTFDLGADKLAGSVPAERQANPALGLRAIRLGLRERDLLRAQLRAMLRAALRGNVGIMFPMISGVGELRSALEVLEEARESLRARGVSFAEEVPVGCMIEVPAAVAVADMLARHVGFLSIGTNDLIQYALAIDRANEHVAGLYQPLHPAILRLIRRTLEAASEAGIPVGTCGAMAEDPVALPVLVGMGLRRISIAPSAVPEARAVIRAIRFDAARALVDDVATRETPEEVAERAAAFAAAAFPGLLKELR